MMKENKSKRNIKEIIITGVCIVLGIGLLLSRMHRLGVFDNWEFPQEEKSYVNGVFADETYKELIDRGYHLESLQRVETEKKRAERFIRNDLGITDFETIEKVRFTNDFEFVEFYIDFKYEENDYELRGSSCRHKKTSTFSYDMNITGESQESMRTLSQMPIDKTLTNQIGEYIGVKNAYELFDTNRKNIAYNEKTSSYMYNQDIDEHHLEIYEYKENLYNYLFKLY